MSFIVFICCASMWLLAADAAVVEDVVAVMVGVVVGVVLGRLILLLKLLDD